MRQASCLSFPLSEEREERKDREVKRITFWGVVAAVAGLLSTPAAADYDFSGITSNNPANVAIGEAQFSMSVSDLGGGQVQFDFSNVGPDPATIRLIAFEDNDASGVLASLDSLVQDGVGVLFSIELPPSNLPGGSFDEDFGVDADPPPSANGIDPGETLGIIANLAGAATYADVIAALNAGTLRVGMHSISMGEDANSEAFINNVPGPGGLALLAAAMVMSRSRRRRA